ncbi:GNAT family N-acetyltransferase [Actinomycetospora sp. TBRC 11914]|uniref:GNAT family N-acetyltransferase n=1 Tax=Actinomycetospora sp. TBRC 11914 TaxID=2729387 RepID=UPI00145EAF70|nr:GNAT family N-acetyltransferase [Actinomycetospora sp. TBRC 11914]NMO90392.1 GNAT family N-acetyltransferase [Actinomycetospora sp. TBRC 11914]
MSAAALGSRQDLVEVDPRDDPRWAAWIAGGRGSLFSSPPWLRAVCRTYGFTAHARLLLASGAVDGAVEGGVAWVPVDDVRGPRRVSLPFSDRADPLPRDPAVLARLLADRPDDAPWTLRLLEPDGPFLPPGGEVTGRAAWHATTIDADDDTLSARLHPTARRNIRVAARRGVHVRRGTSAADLHTLHALHVQRRRERYGMLAPPVDLFDELAAEFDPDDTMTVLLAEVDGQAVAGALFLEWDGVLYYKFGASRAGALPLRPNDALFWAGLRHAVDRGLGALDWGVSDLDQPGLVGFKRKWADDERHVTALRLGPPSSSVPVDRLLGAVTALLTDPLVPDELTARAGRELYRYFC